METANKINLLLNKNININFTGDISDSNPSILVADNCKLKQYFPNFDFTPFDYGLKNTTQWFKKL